MCIPEHKGFGFGFCLFVCLRLFLNCSIWVCSFLVFEFWSSKDLGLTQRPVSTGAFARPCKERVTCNTGGG